MRRLRREGRVAQGRRGTRHPKKRGLAHQGAGLFKIRPKPENGLWRISGRAGRCACYRHRIANAMV
ncbi:hypothetical protein DYQ91_09300 [Xanthomonas sp. LMG 8989]|nr:hypothetical protein [Xanthomonas sp. LMG 8989]